MSDEEALKKLHELVLNEPMRVTQYLMWLLKSDGQDKQSLKEIEEAIK